MDLSGLLPFGKHEQFIEMYFSRMSEAAFPGFAKVSLDQVLRADRVIFAARAKKCRTCIRPVGGKKPIEEALPEILKDPTITLGLMRFQASSGSGKGKGHAASEPWSGNLPQEAFQEQQGAQKRKNNSQRKRHKEIIKTLEQQLTSGKGEKGQGEGG